MECDYRAVACVVMDIPHDIVWRQELRVVTCDEVPHHDAVFVLESVVLGRSHPSVWRAEEVGVYQLVTFCDILLISPYAVACAPEMVEGVVTYAVPLVHNLFI